IRSPMATERYHGSAFRAGIYGFFHPIGKGLSRLLKPLRRGTKEEVPPAAGALLARSHALSDAGDYAGAIAAARQAADIVEGGLWPTRDIGGALVRLGDCARGLKLMAPALRLGDTGAREWKGESLVGRTLVVWQRTRSDMGAPIRLARFIAHAER